MKNKFFKLFLLIVIWVGFLFAFNFLKKTYLADVYYAKSQKLLEVTQIEDSQEYADLAVKLNSHEENYYRGRAKVNVVSLVSVSDVDKPVVKKKILQDLEYAVNLNPNNLVVIRNSVPLYFFISTKDLSKPANAKNIDYTYLPYAKNFFNEIKTKYSHDAGVVSLIAKFEKRLGLEEEYAKSIELVKTLRPDLLEWHESFR